MTLLHWFFSRFWPISLFLCLFMLSLKGHSQTQTFENYFKQGLEKIKQKDYRRAIVDFTIAIEIEPKIEGYLQRAKARQLSDDLEGAIKDYDEALNLNGDNAILFNNRGNLKDQLNFPLEAINDYDRAIALDTSYTNAYYNRAIAKYNVQDYEGSQVDFQTVLKLSPEDGTAYLGLGLCAYKMKDQEAACAHFIEAMRANPALAEAYLKRYCR